MSRLHAFAALLLLATGLAAAPASLRAEPPAALDEEAAAQLEVTWVERLGEARSQLSAARERAAQAEHAYRDMRQRDYPRGEARVEIEEELAAARLALEEAEAAYPRLLDEAREAGVPPGTLRPFEAPQSR